MVHENRIGSAACRSADHRGIHKANTARAGVVIWQSSAEDEHWKRRVQRLKDQSESRVSAKSLAAALARYNQRFNNSEEVNLAIEAIAGGAPVVVGGQQAGLWTGPLLVIHKAISVISAARHAAQLTGQAVIPLFWIAGEDHDWDEANHAHIVNQDNQLVKIAIARPDGSRTSVSRSKVDQAAMLEAARLLGETLPDSEYKRELLACLTAFARQSETLSEWFAFTLGWLFGKQGLVLLDSDDPELRRLEAPMFKQIIERNDELEDAYKRGADTIRQQGYVPQAEVVDGSANFFLFQGERMKRLEREPCFLSGMAGLRTVEGLSHGRVLS